MSPGYHETSYVDTGHAIQAKHYYVASSSSSALCTGHCTVLCKVYRQDKKQQSAGKHRPCPGADGVSLFPDSVDYKVASLCQRFGWLRCN